MSAEPLKISACLPVNSLRIGELLLAPESAAELRACCFELVVVAHEVDEQQLQTRVDAFSGSRTLMFVGKEFRGRMAALRDRSARSAQGEFLLLIDDDIVCRPGFAAAVQQCAAFLAATPECGLVLLGGALGGHNYGQRTVPFRGHNPTMGHGMLVRKGELFPAHELDNLGGGEEILLCAAVNARGQWIAKRFNVPAVHKRQGRSRQLHRGAASVIHDLDVALANNLRAAAALLGAKEVVGRPVFNRAWRFPPDPVAAEFVRKHWANDDRRPFSTVRDGVEFPSAGAALRGLPLSPQAARALRARLRAGERVEVCGSILERTSRG
jgi:hypothetical protein